MPAGANARPCGTGAATRSWPTTARPRSIWRARSTGTTCACRPCPIDKEYRRPQMTGPYSWLDENGREVEYSPEVGNIATFVADAEHDHRRPARPGRPLRRGRVRTRGHPPRRRRAGRHPLHHRAFAGGRHLPLPADRGHAGIPGAHDHRAGVRGARRRRLRQPLHRLHRGHARRRRRRRHDHRRLFRQPGPLHGPGALPALRRRPASNDRSRPRTPRAASSSSTRTAIPGPSSTT